MIGMAVLGCGRIGRMHARNLAQHPRARLVTVYDISAEAAKQTAAELHVEAAASIDEVLSNPDVQAVLIATSTATHVPLLSAAVKAGKAVLCEKPIDLDLARAEACWREIAPYDPVVMIGFNRRFDPSFRAVRERLNSGEIGQLELASITSRDPAPPSLEYVRGSGGLFRDMTIHDFDMARSLAGDIVEVHAFGANLVAPMFGEVGDVDTCVVSLRAASGALVQINNTRRCIYGYDQRIEVFGSKGMLQAGNQRSTSVELWNAALTGARDRVLDFFVERYRQAYDAEVDAFLAALTSGERVSPDFADGLAAQRLAVAAEDSLRSGRVIRISGGGT